MLTTNATKLAATMLRLVKRLLKWGAQVENFAKHQASASQDIKLSKELILLTIQ